MNDDRSFSNLSISAVSPDQLKFGSRSTLALLLRSTAQMLKGSNLRVLFRPYFTGRLPSVWNIAQTDLISELSTYIPLQTRTLRFESVFCS